MMKQCRTCHEVLRKEEYSVSNGYSRKDCKKCFSDKQRDRYKKRSPADKARIEVRRLMRKSEFTDGVNLQVEDLKTKCGECKVALSHMDIPWNAESGISHLLSELMSHISVTNAELIVLNDEVTKLTKERNELEEECEELNADLITQLDKE
jgi:hypothetical protein